MALSSAGQLLIGNLPCGAPALAVPNRQERDSDDEQERADEQRQLAFNGRQFKELSTHPAPYGRWPRS